MIILNEAKPKYERLDQILEDYVKNIKFSNNVNIIIDLKEILKKFYRPDVNANFEQPKLLIEEISSDIINTIGHYRNYFYKHGKYSTFYILYSFEKCTEILKLYLNYKKDYYEKYFNQEDERFQIIRSAAKAIEKVSNRLPHTKFIDTSNFDEFLYAKYIQSVSNKSDLTLILTNDVIFSQLVSDNTILLSLKGIRSDITTKENIISYLTEKKEDFNFDTELLPLLFSLSGLKKYNIEGILGTGIIRSAKVINELLATEKIVNSQTISFPINFECLNPKNKLENKLLANRDAISKNYSVIRLDSLFYNKSNELIMLSKLSDNSHLNLSDYTIFKDINSKIFTMYPLNLDMLFKGESK